MADKKAAAIILQEVQRVIDSETLIKTPIDQMDEETMLYVWSVLDVIEKKLTSVRKAAIRDILLPVAKQFGVANDKGSMVYEVPNTDGSVTAQKKSGATSIKVKELIALLVDKGFSDDAMKSVISFEPTVSESALENLIVNGVISKEELAEVTSVGDPSWAFTVKKPKVITKMLKE